MISYILRRLLLIPITLFGIIALNFLVVQFAPGGPVEQVLAQLQGLETSATSRVSSQTIDSLSTDSKYRGAQGLPPELVRDIEKKFGFDKPPFERFIIMVKNYALFDFGESYFRSQDVVEVIIDKLPVSLSLGLWSTLLVYLISIPLGIRKAVLDGSYFDTSTSYIIFFCYAMPSFLFSILLIVVFAGGQYLDLFPLRGLTSDNWDTFTPVDKVLDYVWHLILPVLAMAIGGVASLTMLTKNSFLDEINKQYVLTARSKGLASKQVLYGHIFRNAMLVVIAGFPASLIGMLFTGSLLIEVIFSLDGLGLLGFESIVNRDYPVVFGTLYIFSLIGLVVNLLSDLMYHIVDPRIDFESKSI
jgi:microcin C transport system permease protein